MSVAKKVTPERRQQATQLIEELKNERHQVWSMYCHVADLKPFTANTKVKKNIQKFSQLLVDYISLGHFGIYERLINGKERRNAVLEIAEKIYPELSKTTDAALAFNDKYENTETNLNTESLAQDLSVLGEQLAVRIELEDKLCNILIC